MKEKTYAVEFKYKGLEADVAVYLGLRHVGTYLVLHGILELRATSKKQAREDALRMLRSHMPNIGDGIKVVHVERRG